MLGCSSSRSSPACHLGLRETSDDPSLACRLSYFIQTPPNRIQRTQTARHLPCGPDRSILGTVLFGITRLGHVRSPRTTHKAPLPQTSTDPHPTTRLATSNKTPACHSPNHLQAGHRGGGHTNMPESPTLLVDRTPRTKRQRVTHPTTCKQAIGEEGTPTCPKQATDRERQPAKLATTSPQPERRLHNPFRRANRDTARVNSLHAPDPATKTTLTRVSHDPPSGAAERSVLPSQMRTGTTK